MPRNDAEHAADALLRQAPCPPRGRTRVPRLLYPRASESLDFVALEPTVQGFLSHWYHGNPIPCVGLEGDCQACREGWGARWYGYLPSILRASGAKYLAVITEGAYRECPEMHRLDGRLRGYEFRLRRMNASNTGPVQCKILAGPRPEPLPASWDVRTALATLWRLDRLLFRAQRIGDTAAMREIATQAAHGHKEGHSDA